MKWIFVIFAVLCVTCSAKDNLECYNCVRGHNATEALPHCSTKSHTKNCGNLTMCQEFVQEILIKGQKTNATTYGCADTAKLTKLNVVTTTPDYIWDDDGRYRFCDEKLCNKPEEQANSANGLSSVGHIQIAFALFLLNQLRFLF